jgi:hypothetical protein
MDMEAYRWFIYRYSVFFSGPNFNYGYHYPGYAVGPQRAEFGHTVYDSYPYGYYKPQRSSIWFPRPANSRQSRPWYNVGAEYTLPGGVTVLCVDSVFSSTGNFWVKAPV